MRKQVYAKASICESKYMRKQNKRLNLFLLIFSLNKNTYGKG
jgi:hypothetical protein